MSSSDPKDSTRLEANLRRWREHALRAQQSAGVARLETRLMAEVEHLRRSGLTLDESWLVALRRVGDDDRATRAFGRENASVFWQNPSDSEAPRVPWRETILALGCAAGAAAAIKVPHVFGLTFAGHEGFYARNAALLILPFLAVFLLWRRGFPAGTMASVAVAFAAAAVLVNTPPFRSDGALVTLAASHLPIALWFVVGVAHANGCWRETTARLEFVRFSGEVFIHGVLIALGGGVLIACLTMIFRAIGLDIREVIGTWLVPGGAASAVVGAECLSDGRCGPAGGMAPLLTRIFTPLFAMLLVTFLATVALTGRGVTADREVLIGFDVLLAVVVGLLLYAVVSRDPGSPPGLFDRLQLVLVVSALLADLIALWAIGSRIREFGFSPNRVAALGENLILLVNLAWSAVLCGRFVFGRGDFAPLERWQARCLPLYAGWAALVAVVFPLLWG